MKKTSRFLIVSVWLMFCSVVHATQPAQLTPLAFSSLMTDVASAEQQVIAVGEQGHILYSKDNGLHWAQANVPVDNLLTSVAMLNKSTAWAVGHDGVILKTDDGGETWTLLYSMYQESGAEFVDPLLDVTFWTEQDGLVVGAFGQLYRTKDGGHSWMDLRSELPNEDELHLNAVMRNADQSIWIASEYGSLFYSADDGQTWQLTTLPSDGTFFSLAYKAGSREIIAAGITGNCFSVSRDTLAAKQIPLRSTQSLYGAEVLDGKLHLVGAKGSWQAGQELNIDDNRINRHAITQTQSGAFIIATAQGVQAFSATAQVIKLYYKTEENK